MWQQSSFDLFSRVFRIARSRFLKSFFTFKPLSALCTINFPIVPNVAQEYQEYLQMEKQLLEELGIREESDDPIEV